MNIAKSNRENTLCIPMSKEEKQDVQKAADDMGVSMSAFVRLVLKDFIKNAKK